MGRYLASENIEVNGVCIHYAVIGEGRPVVLVHGNGESHNLFNTQIEQLVSAGYKVFAPDSRGHGANEPLTEYHYADMAEDMYCFIKTLKLDKPAFYGHSDGGIIGLMLETTHPGTLGVLAASGANLSPEGLDNRMSSILEKFKDEKWQNLDEDERMKIITDYANEIGEGLGLDSIPNIWRNV